VGGFYCATLPPSTPKALIFGRFLRPPEDGGAVPEQRGGKLS